MPPTNADYSVSFRSNLMCGTVVVIDGITAWRVTLPVRLWLLWTSSPCYPTILVIFWRMHTTTHFYVLGKEKKRNERNEKVDLHI